MKEEWRPVTGYEKLYEVSNFGRIRSLDRFFIRKNGRPLRCKGRLLDPYISIYGYYIVSLCDKGNSHVTALHKVVASEFIPNPDNLPCINHKDENKLNNQADNLEWCTIQYNNAYGTRNKRISDAQKRIPVKQFDLNGTHIKTWESISLVENTIGVSASKIVQVCKGKRNKTGGYIWRYANK